MEGFFAKNGVAGIKILIFFHLDDCFLIPREKSDRKDKSDGDLFYFIRKKGRKRQQKKPAYRQKSGDNGLIDGFLLFLLTGQLGLSVGDL